MSNITNGIELPVKIKYEVDENTALLCLRICNMFCKQNGYEIKESKESQDEYAYWYNAT